MILCNAKFLTNYDLKRTYTKNFKVNTHKFIYIKTMVTLIFLKKYIKRNLGNNKIN